MGGGRHHKDDIEIQTRQYSIRSNQLENLLKFETGRNPAVRAEQSRHFIPEKLL